MILFATIHVCMFACTACVCTRARAVSNISAQPFMRYVPLTFQSWLKIPITKRDEIPPPHTPSPFPKFDAEMEKVFMAKSVGRDFLNPIRVN